MLPSNISNMGFTYSIPGISGKGRVADPGEVDRIREKKNWIRSLKNTDSDPKNKTFIFVLVRMDGENLLNTACSDMVAHWNSSNQVREAAKKLNFFSH